MTSGNTTSSAAASIKGCCCCLVLLLSFLLLLSLAVILVIVLAIKPKKPQFNLQQVTVQYFNPTESNNSNVVLTFRMLFNAKNDNIAGIKYSDSTFTIMYRGVPVGRGWVRGFYQAARSQKSVATTTVSVDRSNLLQADAEALVRDVTVNDRVELRVMGDVNAKIRVIGITSPTVQVMDFSELTDAMASRSYNKVADICDQLMLQIASQGVAFQDEWPYAVHLLGHIYLNDLNSARFLWKSIPVSIKESRPEVTAVWKIGQQLWTRNYAGVYDSIRGFNWSAEIQDFVASFAERYTRRMLALLMSAYSTISIQDTALFLGMNENDATSYVLQQGWTVDAASQMLTVKKHAVVTEQKIDPSKLQRLTEYVFHLEH